MSKRRSYIVVVAAAGLAALILAAPAQADPIRFDNPAHGQPGHFEWAVEAPTATHYLRVNLPVESQGDLPEPGVAGAYNHKYVLADSASTIGRGTAGQVQKGGVHTATIAAFDFGQTVPSATFTWGNSGTVTSPVTGTNFPEGLEKYVGVNFTGGDGVHYGWIGVVRTGLQLDAFAWGYETTPGTPIPAGAPEPGTLALLAFGAVAAMRRKA